MAFSLIYTHTHTYTIWLFLSWSAIKKSLVFISFKSSKYSISTFFVSMGINFFLFSGVLCFCCLSASCIYIKFDDALQGGQLGKQEDQIGQSRCLWTGQNQKHKFRFIIDLLTAWDGAMREKRMQSAWLVCANTPWRTRNENRDGNGAMTSRAWTEKHDNVRVVGVVYG